MRYVFPHNADGERSFRTLKWMKVAKSVTILKLDLQSSNMIGRVKVTYIWPNMGWSEIPNTTTKKNKGRRASDEIWYDA